MKCKICGKEIPDQQRFCEFCGQPVGAESASAAICAAAESHWKEAAEQNQQYEAKRGAVSARVRKKCRRIRIRWVLMALLVIGLVWFLGFTDAGQNLKETTVGYANAWWDMEEGRYHEAYDILQELDRDFPGVPEGIWRCEEVFRQERYAEAQTLFEKGSYHEALHIYQELGYYWDSDERALQCLDAIRRGMAPPVIQWTFEEDFTATDGRRWNHSGAECIKVIDSQIPRAVHLNDKDRMRTPDLITLAEEWTVSLMAANLDQENRVLMSIYDGEGGFCGQLFVHNNRLGWTQNTAEGVFWLEGGQLAAPGSRWYDIALSRNGNWLSLYVDGVEKSSMPCPGLPEGAHDVMLYLGDWDHRTEETQEFAPFRGFVASVEVYDYAMTEVEAMFRYEPMAYNATHLWDTSYYLMEEDNPEQDHFVFLRLEEYGNLICLVMLHQDDPSDLITLNWNKDYGTLEILNSASLTGFDLYVQEDGQNHYVSFFEGHHAVYNVTEVISSDLTVFTSDGGEIPPVILGGRG